MASNRDEIRAAIVTRLKAALIGAAVFDQRYSSYKNIPIVNVTSAGDTSVISPDQLNNFRDEIFNIIITVEGLEEHEEPESGELTLNERLKVLVNNVESQLTTFRETFSGLCQWFVYSGTKIIPPSKREGTLIGSAIVSYDARVNEALTVE